MAVEVIMPKAGIDMTEGQIVKWNKKEGEKVEEGEILLEIMTDKTSMELEAEASGYLIKVLKQDGETVPVTEVIGYIGAEGEKAPTGAAPQAAPEPVAAAQPAASTSNEPKAPKGDDEFDVVVIGGGPAGYVAAIKAAQLGGKVAIVEKVHFGGTCLNKGCIPTKTFLKNAEIIEGIEMAGKRGIILENDKFTIDMPKVVKLKNDIVKTLTNGVQGLLKSNDVKIYNGIGKINVDKDVVVTNDKGETVLRTDKIILAGGSKVGRINIPGIDSPKVLTSDDILDIQQIPKSLAVIGGGVVGIELGQVFNSFGSEVTVVEMMDRIIPGVDRESSETLRKELEKKGMKILTSTAIKEIVDNGDTLTIKVDGKDDIVAEKALLSIGRVPDLEGIGEIDLDLENGKVKVDKYMETSVKGIYAPGDINGTRMLAHAAFRMGEIAAENAIQGNHRATRLETNSSASIYTIPSAIYTVPEVAMVGLTEEQAKEKYDISVGKFAFVGNGRALASGESAGFVKVIADKKYGEILGVHIVGPSAAEIINEAATLMKMEITVDEVIKTIHGHPTYSEALFEACADVLGEAVHLPKKKK